MTMIQAKLAQAISSGLSEEDKQPKQSQSVANDWSILTDLSCTDISLFT